MDPSLVPFANDGLFAVATNHAFPNDILDLILGYLDEPVAWYLGRTRGKNCRIKFMLYFATVGWTTPFEMLMPFCRPEHIAEMRRICLHATALHNHVGIMLLCLRWNVTYSDVHSAARTAANSGHDATFRLCVMNTWRASDFIDYATEAAQNGHLSIIKLCYGQISRKHRDRLIKVVRPRAALNGQLAIVQWLNEKEATLVSCCVIA